MYRHEVYKFIPNVISRKLQVFLKQKGKIIKLKLVRAPIFTLQHFHPSINSRFRPAASNPARNRVEALTHHWANVANVGPIVGERCNENHTRKTAMYLFCASHSPSFKGEGSGMACWGKHHRSPLFGGERGSAGWWGKQPTLSPGALSALNHPYPVTTGVHSRGCPRCPRRPRPPGPPDTCHCALPPAGLSERATPSPLVPTR